MAVIHYVTDANAAEAGDLRRHRVSSLSFIHAALERFKTDFGLSSIPLLFFHTGEVTSSRGPVSLENDALLPFVDRLSYC